MIPPPTTPMKRGLFLAILLQVLFFSWLLSVISNKISYTFNSNKGPILGSVINKIQIQTYVIQRAGGFFGSIQMMQGMPYIEDR
ncbi:hypothetical protein Hdeb2414_s0003g00103251 [Helianthus debilis subsp. tardiflorus]